MLQDKSSTNRDREKGCYKKKRQKITKMILGLPVAFGSVQQKKTWLKTDVGHVFFNATFQKPSWQRGGGREGGVEQEQEVSPVLSR